MKANDLKALKMYHQDLSKLFAKLEKKIADDSVKRQKAIETACDNYESEDEINNDWGWGFITSSERDRLLGIFRDLESSKEDLALLKYRSMLATDIRNIKSEMDGDE